MFKQHVRRTVVFTILGVLAAFILAKLTRSVFEANLEMILGEQSLGRTVNQSPFSPEVEKILNKASTQSAETERQIISSASTFFGAVSKVSDRTRNRELMADFQDLYKMYNIESARVNTQEEAAAVVSVKVRAYDVKDAKAIALEVANVYNDQRKETATKAVADAVAFLESQIPSAQKDLQAKEDLTTKYKEESGVQDLDVNLRELVGARSTLETTRDGLKRQIQSGEAQLASMSGKAAALPARVAESSSEQIDSRILQLEGQLQELTARRLQLLALYLADAPEVKKVDEQIKARNADIATYKKGGTMRTGGNSSIRNPELAQLKTQQNNITAEVAGLREQISLVESQLAEKVAQINAMPGKTQKLAKLLTDSNISRQRYSALTEQLNYLKDRGESQFRQTTVLGPAIADEKAVAPDQSKWIFIGGVSGFCLGLLISFMVESLKLRVHTSTQLAELTGLPVAAAVPVLRSGEARGLKAFASPNVPPLEPYRFMSFAKLQPTEVPRSFMFTGVQSAAGSFTGALNFAKASAQAGYRVLLVDGDLSRQGLSKCFEATGKRGFGNLLSEDPASLSNTEIVVSTAIENLMLLPAGSAAINAVTDVPTKRIDAVMEAVKKYADVVIFAMPPCDVLADAAAVSHHVDEACLVVSARTTMYRQIPMAADILAKAGATNLQIILTDANSDEEPFTKRVSYLAKTD